MKTVTQKLSRKVEATLRSSSAVIELAHYHFGAPPCGVLTNGREFRFELSLTSRHQSARACYHQLWNPNRYERLGDFFVLAPDVEITVKSDEVAPLTSITCWLAQEPLLSLFDEVPTPNDKFLIATLDVPDIRARNLMVRLAEEAKMPGFASEMLVEAVVMQMIVELFRFATVALEQDVRGGLAPWQLRVIEERLNDVCEAPTVSALADLCKISVRQLARSFRQSKGSTIGSHVIQRQIEHAKDLLAKDNSVASIAAILGFSSSSNFSVAFRRETGLTPGQFRQRLLQKKGR